MRRLLLSVAVAAAAGCSSTPTSPVAGLPVYPSWFLSLVDGQSPSVPDETGATLVTANLMFESYNGSATAGTGIVRYARYLLRNGQIERSEVELDFSIRDGSLRIALCPRGALCLAVPDDWIGPIAGRTAPLVLTRHRGGQVGSTFQFAAALPD